MCHSDILRSKLQSAYAVAQQVAAEFGQHGDADRQSEALSALSYCAASMGLHAVAMEAATKARALLDAAALALPRRAAALNYLGVAYFWAGDSTGARSSLEAALRYAAASQPIAGTFHPQANRTFAELLDVDEQDSDNLGDLLVEGSALLHLSRQEPKDSLSPVPQVIGLLLLDFILAYIHTSLGKDLDATRHLEAFVARAKALDPNSWLHALPWWVRGEHARRNRDATKALNCLFVLEVLADRGHHATLSQLARRRQTRVMEGFAHQA